MATDRQIEGAFDALERQNAEQRAAAIPAALEIVLDKHRFRLRNEGSVLDRDARLVELWDAIVNADAAL